MPPFEKYRDSSTVLKQEGLEDYEIRIPYLDGRVINLDKKRTEKREHIQEILAPAESILEKVIRYQDHAKREITKKGQIVNALNILLESKYLARQGLDYINDQANTQYENHLRNLKASLIGREQQAWSLALNRNGNVTYLG